MIKELEILPDVSFIGNTTLESIEAEMKSDYEKKYNEVTGESLVLADRIRHPDFVCMCGTVLSGLQVYR